jgi:hypothetical protein
MATFQKGSTVAVLFGAVEVVCKVSSTITFTNESILVRNRCTGDYGSRLTGGNKTGSISVTGDYDKAPSAGNLSAFDLAAVLGTVGEAIWGGTESGDEIVTVNVQLNNIEVTADNETQISFSATMDFSGQPAFSTVPT